MPAGLQDIVKADHVALDVGIRILNGIPHAGLGGQVHHNVKLIIGKQLINQRFVGQVSLDETILAFGFFARAQNDREPVVLQGRVVVIIEIIQAHNVHGGTLKTLFQEPQHQIAANKSGTAGYQNLLHFPLNLRFASS